MQVTAIYTGGVFRVHKAGCADIRRRPGHHETTFTAATQLDAVKEVWADMIDENDVMDAEAYREYTEFPPCASALPR